MRKLIVTFAVLVLAAVAAATASASPLYAPIYSSDQVAAFNPLPDGSFAPLAGSPFSTPMGGTNTFVTTPDGRKGASGFLFDGGFRGFSIGAAGEITPAQDKISTGSNDAYNGAVSPDSKFAYFGTRDYPASISAGVRAYAFSETGALTEVSGSPFRTVNEYLDVAITPNGKFLFASGPNLISRFSIGSDGALTHLGDTATPGPFYMMASPDGRFLFVLGASLTFPSIYSFAVGVDGSLTPIGTPFVALDSGARLPGISPDGRFIYFPESNADDLHTLRVNPDGTLALVGTRDLNDIESVVVTPDSRRLIAYRKDPGLELAVADIGPDGQPGAFTKFADYDPGEPLRMHFRTGHGTIAEFAPKAATKPLTMNFDAAKTTAVQETLGRFEWNFGDGTSTLSGGVAPQHKYAKAGVYDVTLTARDAGGCANEVSFTGQTATCMGTPRAVKTIKVDTPPWITSMSVSPKSVGSKTKIKFKLTEKSRVTFFAQKPAAGRLVGKSCRKPSAKNRKGKRCTRWLRASKSLRANGKKGSNSLKFTGKIGKSTLKRGRYRIAATAVDSAKGKSPQRTAAFRKR